MRFFQVVKLFTQNIALSQLTFLVQILPVVCGTHEMYIVDVSKFLKK